MVYIHWLHVLACKWLLLSQDKMWCFLFVKIWSLSYHFNFSFLWQVPYSYSQYSYLYTPSAIQGHYIHRHAYSVQHVHINTESQTSFEKMKIDFSAFVSTKCKIREFCGNWFLWNKSWTKYFLCLITGKHFCRIIWLNLHVNFWQEFICCSFTILCCTCKCKWNMRNY